MIFRCRECSFQAVFFEILNKFQVFTIGNPFVSHACQTEDTMRELIEELDIDMPETEVEY